jgi:hypothetical protein
VNAGVRHHCDDRSREFHTCLFSILRPFLRHSSWQSVLLRTLKTESRCFGQLGHIFCLRMCPSCQSSSRFSRLHCDYWSQNCLRKPGEEFLEHQGLEITSTTGSLQPGRKHHLTASSDAVSTVQYDTVQTKQPTNWHK